MKFKLLLVFFCLTACLFSFAQTPNQNLNNSNKKTTFGYQGPLTSNGYIVKGFANMDSLNAEPYLRGIPGIKVRIGDTLYYRSSDTTRWIPILSGWNSVTGTFSGVDSIKANSNFQLFWYVGGNVYSTQIGGPGVDSVRFVSSTICIYENHNPTPECHAFVGDTVLVFDPDVLTVNGDEACWTLDAVQTCLTINNQPNGITSVAFNYDSSFVYYYSGAVLVDSLSSLLSYGDSCFIQRDSSNGKKYIYLNPNCRGTTGFETGLVKAFPVLSDTSVTLTMTTEWKRLGITYTDNSLPVFPFPRTTPGYQRQDAIIILSNNTFDTAQGREDTTTIPSPTIPPDAIVVATVLIRGDTVTLNPTGVTDSLHWNRAGNNITSGPSILGSTTPTPVYVTASGIPLSILDPNGYTRYVRALWMDTMALSGTDKSSQSIVFKFIRNGVLQQAGISGSDGNLVFGAPSGMTFIGGQGIYYFGGDAQIWGASSLDLFTTSTTKGIIIRNRYIQATGDLLKISNSSVFNSNDKWKMKMDVDGKTKWGDDSLLAGYNASALAEFISTTKGVLLPRMTAVQRFGISPAKGLLVFDDDSSSLFQYNGSEWQNLYNITGGGGGVDATAWHKGGDAGTDYTIDGLGTTDAQPLRLIVNNLQAGLWDYNDNNFYLGYRAGETQAASGFEENTAIGQYSQQFCSSCVGSTSLGWQTLRENVSGQYNVAIGKETLPQSLGSRNTAIGVTAGVNLINGDDNIFIGYNADVQSDGISNSIAIGTSVGCSNCIAIGDSTGGPDQNTGFGTNFPLYKVDVFGDVNVSGVYRINGVEVTAPDLSGFVPYSGATGDVNLGIHNLTTSGNIGTTGGAITGVTGSFSSSVTVNTTNTNVINMSTTTINGSTVGTGKIGFSFASQGILDFTNITGGDKTFTWPNRTGTILVNASGDLATGMGAFLNSATSANLRTALTDEVGTGAAYFVGGALGTPASATVTNFTGTASININGTVGATTPSTGVFTTLVAGSTTSLLIGTAGSAIGNIGFRNATSGTATLQPPTGALGTYNVTLPNAASTLPIFGQQITFTGPTAARTITLPDASFSAARIDASQTFVGTETMDSIYPKLIRFPQTGGGAQSSSYINFDVGSTATGNGFGWGSTRYFYSDATNSITVNATVFKFSGILVGNTLQASGAGNTTVTLSSTQATIGKTSADAVTAVVIGNSSSSATGAIAAFSSSVSATALVISREGKITQDATITTAGTTGNQTINKPVGTVNIAAAGTTVTVTNSLVSTSSVVYAVLRTNDATATGIKSVVPSAGSFIITLNAATTAEVSIGFEVKN